MTLLGTINIIGTGNELNNTLVGNGAFSTLYGAAGNDTLSAGNGDGTLYGDAGNDTLSGEGGTVTMFGGSDDDVYIVDSALDTINEDLNAGTDEVRASRNFSLGDNFENLTLTGTGDFTGTGNASNNIITGNSGNNILHGLGGSDSLVGGAGDDTYFFLSGELDPLDVITDTSGSDTIHVFESFDLAASGFQGLENVTIQDFNLSAYGNSEENVLTSIGSGNTLVGRNGSDTYVIDNASTVITELLDQGTDLVRSMVSYSLLQNVENLTLLGTDNINGTGNTLNNIITGNSGNNILDGGTGNDTLIGGNGDDTYVINATGDLVTEDDEFGGGYDEIMSSISTTLAFGVEKLSLTGTGNIDATGNRLNNWIVGNDGNNKLFGGLGRDTLTGGAGVDHFIYKIGDLGDPFISASREHSTIDFTQGVDKIVIENAGTITTYAQLQASGRVSTVSGNTMIGEAVGIFGFARNELTIQGLIPSQLSDSDFIFIA